MQSQYLAGSQSEPHNVPGCVKPERAVLLTYREGIFCEGESGWAAVVSKQPESCEILA
jgi:hypothetical protein